MNLEDADVKFNQFNNKCVKDMVETLIELKEVYSALKNEDKVSAEDYKNYVQVYRNITELYYIGSRKQLKPNETEINSESNENKLKELSNMLYGALHLDADVYEKN